MVVLHTIGTAEIRTPHHRITPTAGTLFTLGAYLISLRGTRVARATLTALLWPSDAGTPIARQRLRSALNKLRDRGIPLRTTNAYDYTVWIAKDDATLDVAQLEQGHPEQFLDEDLTILPNFTPAGAPQLAYWMDELRRTIRQQLSQALERHLAAAKARGDWEMMTVLAERLLGLEGDNAHALQAAEYANKLLAARVRHAERSLERSTPQHGTLQTTTTSIDTQLVGRGDDLAILSHLLDDVRQGEGWCVYLWGDAGIGKRRLARELLAIARTDHLMAERIVIQPYDRFRPLAIVRALVPLLNILPGAAGCEATNMAMLRQFLQADLTVTHSAEHDIALEPRDVRLRTAFIDLLDAVTHEQPLVLHLQDAQWLDPLSWEIIAHVAAWARSHPALLLLTTPASPHPHRHSEHLWAHALTPLSASSALQHAHHFLAAHDKESPHAMSDAVLEWCVRITEGNPGLLEETLTLWLQTRVAYQAPPSVINGIRERMASLDRDVRSVLYACAVLGANATHAMLESILALPAHQLLAAIDALVSARLIQNSNTTDTSAHDAALVCANDVIVKTVLELLPPEPAAYLAYRQQHVQQKVSEA